MENTDNKAKDNKDKKIDQDEDELDELSVEYVDDDQFQMEDGELVDEDDYIKAEQKAQEEADDLNEKINKMEIDSEPISNSEFPDFKTDGEIYCIDLNDKGIIAIGDGSDTTYLYNLDSKKQINKFQKNKDSVSVVKFSKDFTYLAAASLDGSVNLFSRTEDQQNYEYISTVEGSFSEINWLEWHPKGNVFAFGCQDGSVWVYQAKYIDNNMSFFGHTESVSCGQFTNNGKYLITGSEDMSVKIWDLKNNCIKDTFKGKKFHKAPISCLCLGKNKDIIATGSFENEIAISNYDAMSILKVIDVGDSQFSVEAIQFCNDDKYVVFSGIENKIQIFDLGTLQIRAKLDLGKETVNKIIASNLNSYLLYLGSSFGYFYVLDTRGNGSFSVRERLHTDVLIDFVMTKDENFAISSSIDKTINLHRLVKL